jgi:hypothetical protein
MASSAIRMWRRSIEHPLNPWLETLEANRGEIRFATAAFRLDRRHVSAEAVSEEGCYSPWDECKLNPERKPQVRAALAGTHPLPFRGVLGGIAGPVNGQGDLGFPESRGTAGLDLQRCERVERGVSGCQQLGKTFRARPTRSPLRRKSLRGIECGGVEARQSGKPGGGQATLARQGIDSPPDPVVRQSRCRLGHSIRLQPPPCYAAGNGKACAADEHACDSSSSPATYAMQGVGRR